MADMELKIAQGIKLTREQVLEIGNTIMQEPDMGWKPWVFDSVADREEWENKHKWEEELRGEYGTYRYRINLSWNMITILSVE
jgi:hypothetical protein